MKAEVIIFIVIWSIFVFAVLSSLVRREKKEEEIKKAGKAEFLYPLFLPFLIIVGFVVGSVIGSVAGFFKMLFGVFEEKA